MSENEPEVEETTVEPAPEPLKFDAPDFDIIEKGDKSGDLQKRINDDIETK